MRNMMKRIALLIALVLMTFVGGYAQEPSQVEKTIDAIVKRYDDVDKVECFTVTKGNGLEMLKMLFNKQFGKDFMRGMTSITVINYSDASEETCLALRKELDAFVTLLEEFNLSGEKKFADNDYVRSFASASSDAGTLSDFVVAIEKEDSKMVMYMAGVMKIE